MNTLTNIFAVARREFTVRARTRSYLFGTALLVIGVVAIAFVPVIIGYVDRTSTQQIAVSTQLRDLAIDPATRIGQVLNAVSTSGDADPNAKPPFTVTDVPDVGAAREAVTKGTYSAVLGIERGANGDLAFTLYTNDPSTSRLPQLVLQAATFLGAQDRASRLGVTPEQQLALAQPVAFDVKWADPARTDPTRNSVEEGTNYLLGFGMTILIFMMVILYGNWVAMSVVEEKSSRVMEVILNAATPFQLMAGKVLGQGLLGLVQYGAILVAGGAALLVQGQVAAAILGEGGGDVTLPAGLTIGMLGILVLYGVLGFLLYAMLYAAAGSLVSRQEDVNAAVMPMTLVSTAGYMVAVYAGTGLLDIRSGWMAVLAQVPFVSPFLMLSRVTSGQAAIWEIVLSVAILVVSILAALWIAARIYAVGVLLYGQRPGFRVVWRLLRAGM